MLVKNKDASSITLRNQNRMLYANYIVQQKRVEGGCQLRVQLENGGTADFSIIPKLLQGAQETTVLEAQTDISANLCPTLSIPIPDPYLSDAIYISLTPANQILYKAASSGTWLAISSTEYTALQTNVSGTSLVGTDSSTFSSITGGSFTQQNFAAANNDTSFTPKIAANTYLFAFAIRIKSTVTTTLDNIRVYANNSTSVYSGFLMVGSSPIPAPVAGTNYYVYKGQASVNAATDGLLAVTAPGNATLTLAQSAHIAYKTGVDTSISFRYNNGVTLPLSSSTSLSSVAGSTWGLGIQGLTTPTKQWL